jgi:hypothetical protein
METAEDPDAQIELKRAARYLLDHPDLLERLSRSRDGSDVGIAPGTSIRAGRGTAGRWGSTPAPTESDESARSDRPPGVDQVNSDSSAGPAGQGADQRELEGQPRRTPRPRLP